jgi:heme exporter protein B
VNVLYLRQVFTIAAKDLRSELRTKEALNSSFAFSMVILVLFSFAFDPSSEQLHEISGGLLWLVYSFASALSLNRGFARELENDCLDALVASPVPVSALFLGKAVANYALLMAVEMVGFLVFGLLYDVQAAHYFWPVLLVIALGTWAMVVVGTMFSAVTVNLRMREMMLPIIIYPLLLPALMAAMTTTTDLLNGAPFGPNLIFLRVLAAVDLIYTLLSMIFIEFVLVG